MLCYSLKSENAKQNETSRACAAQPPAIADQFGLRPTEWIFNVALVFTPNYNMNAKEYILNASKIENMTQIS